ncbi:glycosyl hydrolase family 28-related protein [Paenibacillus barengoltzii]|uniref:glycosyl hydrolase family 28-related protein n=1 Tax=Paenibacillus TaxID=44249 RepID=UPI00048B5730|nr:MULTISPECIES: glycosyl hydrolase family 28-related protein [Paenibacillus]MEC2345035.1 glycosyl hydrolase family 28-related protein [Paenibacillus barengoltzii]
MAANQSIKKFVLITLVVAVGFLFNFSINPVAANAEPKDAQMINVKDQGAKGDGVTDDTSAIQRALDLAASSKGTVYFPEGTYVVNPVNTLIVESGTTLKGEGKKSVIQADAHKFGWEMIHASGTGIEISDLMLDGNHAVNRVLVIGGGSSFVKVNRIAAANATHSSDPASDFYTGVVSGIVIYGDTNHIEITNSEIYNIKAVNLTAGSLISRGIYITTTWGSAEKVASNVRITNSNIHHIGSADDGDGIFYEDPNLDRGTGRDVGSLIANNTFSFNAKRAIKIYAQGITVSGNIITNSYLNNNYYEGKDKGQLAPDMYAGISVYASNNSISDNRIEGVGSYYAAIEVSADETVNHVTIKGNKIKMGQQSVIAGTTGIRLGNTKNFTISSNTIEHAEKGIWTWQNAENGTVEGNKIETTKGGIDLTTYLANCIQKDIVVKDNIVKGQAFNIQLAKSNVNVKVVSNL